VGPITPLADVTVRLYRDGLLLGQCETDDEGTCCLPIDEIGTYSVVVSHPSYTAQERTVVVEECEPVNEEFEFTSNNPQMCVAYTILGCGCGVQGASVVMSGPNAEWTVSGVTDAEGKLTLCFPQGTVSGTYTYTITAPLYITVTGGGNAEFFTVVNRTLVTQDLDNRFCLGGAPPRCRDMLPSSVNVTLSGFWEFAGLAGVTHNLPRVPSAGQGLYTKCIDNPDPTRPDLARKITFFVRLNIGPTCTEPQATTQLAFGFECNSGGNIINMPQISGSSACPVSFVGRNNQSPSRFITVTA
jgi:hypothetical protein